MLPRVIRQWRIKRHFRKRGTKHLDLIAEKRKEVYQELFQAQRGGRDKEALKIRSFLDGIEWTLKEV